jgi:nucleoside phosphorylase
MSDSTNVSKIDIFVGDSSVYDAIRVKTDEAIHVGDTTTPLCKLAVSSPSRVLLIFANPTPSPQAEKLAFLIQSIFIEHQKLSVWLPLLQRETTDTLSLHALINQAATLKTIATLVQNPEVPAHPHSHLITTLQTAYQLWHNAVLSHIDEAHLSRFRAEYSSTPAILGFRQDGGIRAFLNDPLRPNLMRSLRSQEGSLQNSPGIEETLYRLYQYDLKIHFVDPLSRQVEILQEAIIRQKPPTPTHPPADMESRSGLPQHNLKIHYVVITALPAEMDAVQTVFKKLKKRVIPGSSPKMVYYSANAASESETHSDDNVALYMLSDMGNNHAAAELATLANSFPSAKYFIMCGIAGGIPNIPGKSIFLGDVIVCNQSGVLQYDNIKRNESHDEIRSRPRAPSVALMNAHRRLQIEARQGQCRWKETLKEIIASHPRFVRPTIDKLRKGEQINMPSVIEACVGSANILLKDPAVRDKLARDHQIGAIEMEGSGIADAAHFNERQYFIVRGVCDYCDKDKDDSWHNYAALTAAAYVLALVLEDCELEDEV